MFGKKKEKKVVRNFQVEENINEQNEEMIEEEAPSKKNKKGKSSKKTNTKKKSGGSKKGMLNIPRTAQDTVPYFAAYENGIIEIEPGVFSRSYQLADVNFRTATDEEQKNIFDKYVDFLNTFDSDIRLQLTIFNKSVDNQDIRENILIKPQRDTLNEYREEYNNMLIEKMKEGRNNMEKDKFITITVGAPNIEEATLKLSKIDSDVSTAIKRINFTETYPMTLVERLDILHSIYSSTNQHFYRKGKVDGKNVASFDFKEMIREGLSTKDMICPKSFIFHKDYCEVDNKYVRSYFIQNMPTYISANVLNDITEINSEMLVSANFNKLRPDAAQKLLRNQMVNINSNVIDAQKKAVKAGYDPSLISPELLRAQQEAQDLMDDVAKRNQSLILTTFVITLMANSLEELQRNETLLKTTTGKYLLDIKTFMYQQEKALSTALPLGRCDVFVDRLLTTESAAIFIPFSTQELNENNGMYYGLNAISKNLILFNRKNQRNMNGVILGTPGSGKSFSAKREMINVILNTDDEIYVVDPEQEYVSLAKLLGGEVVSISIGGNVYLNPLDMDINYGVGDEQDGKTQNPIAMKVDFIAGLFEAMAGDGHSLTSAQLSILDRCISMIYRKYMDYMTELRKTHPNITCDTSASPTLKDLYNMLLNQQELEAQSLALVAERFCTGNLDNFAHHTNVRRKNRFTVYDIKNMGESLKELGLKVCLNAIWNQAIENKLVHQKYTWMYIDEFYLLTQTPSSATFLQMIYKRARKWWCLPTGLTQNVTDLLESQEACTILSNCDFVMMLNQSPVDKMQLAQMFGISPTQMGYITNADAGQGLIYNGKTIVPFIDRFPHNKLYNVMTTKPEDVANM